MSEQGERKRRLSPATLGRGAKAGVKRVTNSAQGLAQKLAASPQALATLAGALATAGLGAGVGAAVYTDTVSDRVAKVEQTVTDAELVVASMRAEVEQLRDEADRMVSDVGELAEAIASGDDELAGKIAAAVGARTGDLRASADRLDDMADRLAELENDPVGAGVVAALGQDISDVAGQLDSTGDALEALAGDLDTVSDDLAGAQGALATVGNRVTAVEADIVATNATVAAVLSRVDDVAQQAVDAEIAAEAALGTATAADEKADAVALRLPILTVLPSVEAAAGEEATAREITFTVPGPGNTASGTRSRMAYTFTFAPNTSFCADVKLQVNGFFVRTIPATGTAGVLAGWSGQTSLPVGENTVSYTARGQPVGADNPSGNPCRIVAASYTVTRLGD